MKVLHAAETIKGGVATVINSLMEHQTKQSGLEVICLVPSDQVENLVQLEKLKEFQFNRKGRNLLGMLAFFWTFYKLIISEKPNIVHLHSSFAGLLGRLAIILTGRRNKIKIIYCPHAFGFLMQTSDLKRKFYVIAERILSTVTDKIICVSQSEYNTAIKKGFNAEKLIVIHNGVNVKGKKNIRMSNNNKNYNLLFVGRFDYQKGIDILAQAINELGKNTTDTHYEFTLVGEAVNSDEDITFQEAKNIKVNKLGWLKPEQLEEQYLNHDAIIIPSRWEGFAMVPLEAMSYGLPIIASDIDAFKEIEDHENSHITFFNLNAPSLFACLNNIQNIDFEKNGSSALNNFKIKYTDNIMNKKTSKIYFI